ncbi:hypothetical protein WJU22_15600 [Chitinophaga caseinilytica]|uniref:Uncharacterized protein n=1 Tax=Chitinophaga caseinilytica TaxID=2267521 RepID=A0ABZ2Z0W5_9BACT
MRKISSASSTRHSIDGPIHTPGVIQLRSSPAVWLPRLSIITKNMISTMMAPA